MAKLGSVVFAATLSLALLVVLGIPLLNVGVVQAASGNIDIFKFLDINWDGIRDDGEPGLQGWDFTVSDVGTFTTGADGHVVVSGLAAGTYNVTEIVRDGWTCTSSNPAIPPIRVERLIRRTIRATRTTVITPSTAMLNRQPSPE